MPSCYCGCATLENRVKWGMSIICLGVGCLLFSFALVFLAVEAVNCAQKLTPAQREECLESPEPPEGWSNYCLAVQDRIAACLGADLFKMRRTAYVPVSGYVPVSVGPVAEAEQSTSEPEISQSADLDDDPSQEVSKPLLEQQQPIRI